MASYILSDPNFSDGTRPEVIEEIMDQLRGRDGVKLIGYDPDSDFDRLPAEVQQGKVAAEAETHQGGPVIAAGLFYMVDHPLQVVGGAVVVEPEGAVRFAAAGTLVPGQGVPAGTVQRPYHAQHVGAVGVSLQPVGDDGHPPAGAGLRPVEVEEVAVVGFHPLSPVVDAVRVAKEGGDDGLQVAAGQQEGRAVGQILESRVTCVLHFSPIVVNIRSGTA